MFLGVRQGRGIALQGCLQGSERLWRYSRVKRGRGIAAQGCLQGSGRLSRYSGVKYGVAVLRSRGVYRGMGGYRDIPRINGVAVLRSEVV